MHTWTPNHKKDVNSTVISMRAMSRGCPQIGIEQKLDQVCETRVAQINKRLDREFTQMITKVEK